MPACRAGDRLRQTVHGLWLQELVPFDTVERGTLLPR